MAEVTAGMVKELREKTDAPMMECKKALAEASGDMGRAEEILRAHTAAAGPRPAAARATTAHVTWTPKPIRTRRRPATGPPTPPLMTVASLDRGPCGWTSPP